MRQIRKINDAVEEYHGAAMGDTWYAANGYISYAGDLPLSRLDVVENRNRRRNGCRFRHS